MVRKRDEERGRARQEESARERAREEREGAGRGGADLEAGDVALEDAVDLDDGARELLEERHLGVLHLLHHRLHLRHLPPATEFRLTTLSPDASASRSCTQDGTTWLSGWCALACGENGNSEILGNGPGQGSCTVFGEDGNNGITE
eukprot:3098014-Rhodomonas_salina.2